MLPSPGWHNDSLLYRLTNMNLDRIPTALPDTFALHEGELIALQVNAARALGLADTHFRDTLADGSVARVRRR